MKVERIVIVILVACIGSAGQVYSQEIQTEIDLGIGIPQGEFNNQLDRVGIGVGFMAGYRFANTPVMLGIDFGFLNFGKDTREAPLSTTIPDLRVDVENSYNLVHGDLLLRMIAPPAIIRPYVDGLVGFNYFFTQTVIKERDDISNDDKLSDTNFEDTALSYGFGAGMQIRLWQKKGQMTQTPDDIEASSVYLNLMGRYMFGREAEYLQEGSIIIDDENGEVFYDVSQSTTNLLHIKLGVVVNF